MEYCMCGKVKNDFPVYSRRPLCEKSKTGKNRTELSSYLFRSYVPIEVKAKKKNTSAKLMLHVFKDERQVLFFN